MTLPTWAFEPDAPSLDMLPSILTEALAVTAEARGYGAFAKVARKMGVYDIFRYLCQRAWHHQREWETRTRRFWAVFSEVASDAEMVDLFDTVCTMTPLGDPNDEEDALAYWPDLVATVRGLCGKAAN